MLARGYRKRLPRHLFAVLIGRSREGVIEYFFSSRVVNATTTVGDPKILL